MNWSSRLHFDRTSSPYDWPILNEQTKWRLVVGLGMGEKEAETGNNVGEATGFEGESLSSWLSPLWFHSPLSPVPKPKPINTQGPNYLVEDKSGKHGVPRYSLHIFFLMQGTPFPTIPS